MPLPTSSNGDGHVPVMLAEVLEVLQPSDGDLFVDGTFGRGGYSLALLSAADCRVIGLDRDPEAVGQGRALAAGLGGRLRVLEGRFGDMERLVEATAVDGIALDLGVSSPQLDNPARGFTFRFDAPLDMRMSGQGPSAADAVNGLPERELADVIWRFGEERRARQVARAIVDSRREAPITRTRQLAGIVRRVVKPGRDGLDPATRTFQALRIYVNDELAELERGLGAAERLLAPGGRLAVVSFHSLEDRIVKLFLRARSGRSGAAASRHRPLPAGDTRAATFDLSMRRARRPSAAECAANPRARSARLRAAVRTVADLAQGSAA